jgi:crossover junction endodeoxyribonuclease RuvC
MADQKKGPSPGLTGLTPVLGLDPGSQHTGYGIIETQGGRAVVLAFGRISPRNDWPFPQKLAYIHRQLLQLNLTYKPKAWAVEDVFSYKYPRSALKLAQARGVAVLAAALDDIPIFEYTPTQVKNSLTGQGLADKTQVAFMVRRILDLRDDLPPDAADALAVAICHAGQKVLTPNSPRRSGKSWKSLSPESLLAMGFKIAGN